MFPLFSPHLDIDGAENISTLDYFSVEISRKMINQQIKILPPYVLFIKSQHERYIFSP